MRKRVLEAAIKKGNKILWSQTEFLLTPVVILRMATTNTLDPITMEVKSPVIETVPSEGFYHLGDYKENPSANQLASNHEVGSNQKEIILKKIPNNFVPNVGDSLLLWENFVGKKINLLPLDGSYDNEYPKSSSKECFLVYKEMLVGGILRPYGTLLEAKKGSKGGNYLDCETDWTSYPYSKKADIISCMPFSDIGLDVWILTIIFSE